MKSLAELKAIRDRMQGEVNMREDDNSHHIRVVVGMATCGIASGARPVLNKTPEKADEVVEQHLIRGQVLGKYTLSATNL